MVMAVVGGQVMAVVGGQVVDGFLGAMPEAQGPTGQQGPLHPVQPALLTAVSLLVNFFAPLGAKKFTNLPSGPARPGPARPGPARPGAGTPSAGAWVALVGVRDLFQGGQRRGQRGQSGGERPQAVGQQDAARLE
jgi:hypothetical protein